MSQDIPSGKYFYNFFLIIYLRKC